MPSSAAETARPVLFIVHEPGRSGVEGLAVDLADALDVVALEVAPTDDGAVAAAVGAIRRHGSSRWLIAGSGSAAPVASAVASRTLSGRSGLFGLAGLVLLPGAADQAHDDLPTMPTLVLDATGEAPGAAIRAFWVAYAGTAPAVPADVARTIASARTSTRVRALLAERALADDPHYAPRALTPAQLTTLRAIADRVVPQDGAQGGAGRIDLAARVDAQLADGQGDGWRNAALPADTIAYGLALDALAGFELASTAEQEEQLDALGSEPRGALSGEQLGAWFEDCRVDLVRQWLAHPASMARVGYDGYASGGDTLPLTGFRVLGADGREPWEPTARSLR